MYINTVLRVDSCLDWDGWWISILGCCWCHFNCFIWKNKEGRL